MKISKKVWAPTQKQTKRKAKFTKDRIDKRIDVLFKEELAYISETIFSIKQIKSYN